MTISNLPPREKQIAQIVYRLVECGAAEVHREVRKELSLSAVKTMLGRLAEKKVINKNKTIGRVTFSPAVVDQKVRQAALDRVVASYFGGSRRELLTLLQANPSPPQGRIVSDQH